MDSLENEAICIEMHLDALVSDVWHAWTDASLVLKFFGSEPETLGLDAVLDVRPGGSYSVSFRDTDGTEHNCSGVYLTVDENRKLSFSWVWKSEPGVESIVSVELIPEGKSTLMRFRHADTGTGSAHNYSEGWRGSFSKLKKLLRAKSD